MKTIHAMMFLFILTLAASFTGCAGMTTQHQKIGAACATVQSAGEAIALAADANKVSRADAGRAAALYHSTDSFCEPVADRLTTHDYAILLGAAASLTATAGAAK